MSGRDCGRRRQDAVLQERVGLEEKARARMPPPPAPCPLQRAPRRSGHGHHCGTGLDAGVAPPRPLGEREGREEKGALRLQMTEGMHPGAPFSLHAPTGRGDIHGGLRRSWPGRRGEITGQEEVM